MSFLVKANFLCNGLSRAIGSVLSDSDLELIGDKNLSHLMASGCVEKGEVAAMEPEPSFDDSPEEDSKSESKKKKSKKGG